MCKVEMLRVLVKQRLTAAVEEIFVVLERTIAEYEEELSRTKEENERQRQLLDALFNKHQQTDVTGENCPPQPQEWSSRVAQKEPEQPHFKEEDEEPELIYIKEEEEETEPPHFEDDEEPELIHVKEEPEPPHVKEEEAGKTEADGGSEVDKLLAPLSGSEDMTSHSSDTEDDEDEDKTVRKRFKCSHCDKTFGKKGTLKTHTRYHTGERPFVCSVCGKAFTIKGHLNRHARTHSGEKPHPCSICGTSFGVRSALVQHMRTHTGEKPHACSVCGEKFSQKGNLSRHAKTHTRTQSQGPVFGCATCGKTFSQKGYLKIHRRTHTGERPYACSFCDGSFSVRSVLAKHVSRRHASKDAK
ncbi:zinc finger protein 32-like [Entelurus aequoreus]|uniref:zinc finger protein 32-like n=1 Tax=Entelurus aequoreus TaxID=161455 RepID=UPI002B1E4B34|nr:zinc finger protein 32-like [Entelurus aequoreus]